MNEEMEMEDNSSVGSLNVRIIPQWVLFLFDPTWK